MTSLFNVAQIRAVEHLAARHLPPRGLMLRAADAVARRAIALGEGPYLVIAGPGNNGGDALEAALVLAQTHRGVEVVFLGHPDRLPDDAAAAWRRCVEAGVPIVRTMPDEIRAPIVIDGLFGIGLARALTDVYADAVQRINASAARVLAIDVPSGIDADTGAIVGGLAGCAVRADETITFIADKIGLYTADGLECAGRIVMDDLGIDAALLDPYRPTTVRRNTPDDFAHLLRPRARNTHKGSFGSVAILGGNDGMSGAAHLAARAALLGGAGRVYLHPLGERPAFDVLYPEIMIRAVDALDCAHVVVAGPGLGQDERARTALLQVLDGAPQLVLDADALNLVARDDTFAARMHARARHASFATVITPHPLEAARLLGVTADSVNENRVDAARRLADRYAAQVVLKGAGSVIATTAGDCAINPTGNPGLATGGTGDVLAGLIGAVLAWSGDAAAALCASVWLHGAAADALVARGIGPIGLAAGELPVEIRRVLNELVATSAHPGH